MTHNKEMKEKDRSPVHVVVNRVGLNKKQNK